MFLQLFVIVVEGITVGVCFLLLITTLSLQKKAIRLNNQGKTMIAKDSFVPLL